MAAGFRSTASGPPVIQLTDAEKEETRANTDLTLLFHLSDSSGRKMGCFQLGGELHRSLNLRRFVDVKALGFNWYSAKFTTQSDYEIAFKISSARLFDSYQIEFYQWVLQFQPFLLDGDVIEGCLQQIPSEYCTDSLLTKIADAACASLECTVLVVDSKSSRFFFQSIGTNSCSRLPMQIQIENGPLIGLSYSPAHQCYNCGAFGHLWRNCRRATSSRSVPTHSQVSRRPLPRHPEPVPVTDPGKQQAHLENTNPPVTHKETTPMAPIPRSSGMTTPPRPIAEKEMPAKGAIIVETGRENIPILYTLREEVSKIDLTMSITPLNDQRGNRRRVTIHPHHSHIAPNGTKRVIYTSIDGAEDEVAISMLVDKCRKGDVSMAIVLDKSSVTLTSKGIVKLLGFSASHCAEMTFPSFDSDSSTMDVTGNCLIMWKKKKVRVDVSSLNTERHLEFSASWVVGKSAEEDSQGRSDGFTTTFGEEDTSDESEDESHILFSDTDESSLFSVYGEENSHESSNSSSFPAKGDTDSEPPLFSPGEKELSSEPSLYSGPAEFDETPRLSPNSNTLSPSAESESERSSWSFSSIPGGENSSESSTVSPNRDTDSEESSLSTAEEILIGSSPPSASSEEGEDSFILLL